MFKYNKQTSIVAIVVLMAASNNVIAKHKHQDLNNSYYSTARVINVEPIVRNIQVSLPTRDCWDKEVTHPVVTQRSRDTGNVIFGGLVGGVVGNQFGHGRGKTAATVVGSIIGATIGNEVSKDQYRYAQSTSTTIEHHCQVTHTTQTEERIEGYWVSYRYKGEIFTTRMDEKPNKRLKIRVQVTPVLD